VPTGAGPPQHALGDGTSVDIERAVGWVVILFCICRLLETRGELFAACISEDVIAG
jgi:hypothetical protein